MLWSSPEDDQIIQSLLKRIQSLERERERDKGSELEKRVIKSQTVIGSVVDCPSWAQINSYSAIRNVRGRNDFFGWYVINKGINISLNRDFVRGFESHSIVPGYGAEGLVTGSSGLRWGSRAHARLPLNICFCLTGHKGQQRRRRREQYQYQ